mmetsp:Transcript_15723/g.21164  ORF Transcript_15723/g.21164 Transcript_15723/m.21164 type:complete len:298 (+) Transcript_15723:190-1083(+)
MRKLLPRPSGVGHAKSVIRSLRNGTNCGCIGAPTMRNSSNLNQKSSRKRQQQQKQQQQLLLPPKPPPSAPRSPIILVPSPHAESHRAIGRQPSPPLLPLLRPRHPRERERAEAEWPSEKKPRGEGGRRRRMVVVVVVVRRFRSEDPRGRRVCKRKKGLYYGWLVGWLVGWFSFPRMMVVVTCAGFILLKRRNRTGFFRRRLCCVSTHGYWRRVESRRQKQLEKREVQTEGEFVTKYPPFCGVCGRGIRSTVADLGVWSGLLLVNYIFLLTSEEPNPLESRSKCHGRSGTFLFGRMSI